MRLFIAVDLDYPEELEEFSRALKATGIRMKLVERENFHMTLRFIGEVQEGLVGTIEEALKEACADFNSFSVRLRGIGAFPKPERARVVWVGLEGKEIVELAKRINSTLDARNVPGDRKEFVPHATVARIKERPRKEVVDLLKEWADRDFGVQKVEEVRLKRSTLTQRGPIYEDLAVVQLR